MRKRFAPARTGFSRAATRVAAAALTATLGAALTGCIAIPGAGTVQVGLADLTQVDQPYQLFTPLGPTANASQEDVVRGFVAAATSNADDYAVAREFLSTDYAAQWDPHFGVLIDEGSRTFRGDDDETGVLSLNATAKVDGNGQMLPVAPGATTEMRFEFTKVGGQWRIASAPNGVILDKVTFTEIWAQHQLYFVGSNEVLVPATRWFIARAAVATEIVGGLIAGPTERMRESVHSGFPAGTSLISKSVPVVDGRARIDLSSEILEASPQAISEVRQQLKLSLQSVPGVTGFDMFVEGAPVTAEGGGTEPMFVNEIGSPAVLMNDEFGILNAGEFTPMIGFNDFVAELAPSDISLSYDGRLMAVRGTQGTSLIDASGVVAVDAAEQQIAPSIDAFGYLWTATEDGELHISLEDGPRVSIAAPWLIDHDVAAVRLAPDGMRIAALVENERGAQVLVAGVVRDERGAPERTTDEADTELWLTGEPIDFDWVGPAKFAALTKGGSAAKVTNGGPGMFGAEQGAVQGGTQITGGGARVQLRVLTEDGDLYVPQAGGWQRGERGIEVLAKRG